MLLVSSLHETLFSPPLVFNIFSLLLLLSELIKICLDVASIAVLVLRFVELLDCGCHQIWDTPSILLLFLACAILLFSGIWVISEPGCLRQSPSPSVLC